MWQQLEARVYRVGDEFNSSKIAESLPVGAVVTFVYEQVPTPHGAFIVAAKLADGNWRWMDNDDAETGKVGRRMLGLFVGPWRIAHLPARKPVTVPKVGDVVDTEEQARLLPVGSVLIDDADADPESAAITKIDDNQWLYFFGEPLLETDDVFAEQAHRVVYVPDRADAVTGRTAA